ncbi:glycosyltransferase-like, putative [Bodo saltans]|uniref:Glycosyltransferase-like, putative n=1 Tax=Bodo saltans TaxID=75058 RepID=A0A0S4JVM2_BODSA|nr:glycosyltransferase-like, putative [Bodo saltans]|eukprot:CUG94344.1 glycosyltransferase-like, putative [Bodo saltans]
MPQPIRSSLHGLPCGAPAIMYFALLLLLVGLLLPSGTHALSSRDPEAESYHPHMEPLDAPFRTIKHHGEGSHEDGTTVIHEEFVISWYAPILSQSGYGKEGLEYILAMDAAVEAYWNETSHESVNPTPAGFHDRQPILKKKTKTTSQSQQPANDDDPHKPTADPVSPSHNENMVESLSGDGSATTTGGFSLTPPESPDDFEEEVIPGTKAKLSWAKYPSYVCAENHGDSLDPTVLAGYPPSTRETLRSVMRRASALKHYGIAGFPRYEPSDHRHNSPPPIAVAVCHSEPGAWAVPHPLYDTSHCPPWSAHVAVGRTMFETDRIPAGWVRRIKYMDEVWVPSQFHMETFTKSGVPESKLFVIPESIDVSQSMTTGWGRHRCKVPPANIKKIATNANNNDAETTAVNAFYGSIHRTKMHQRCAFKFLSIFKWEERKGWDVLIKAFYEEFVANADVNVRREDESFSADGVICLLLKTSSYHDGVQDGDDDEYDDQISDFLAAQYGSNFRRKRLPSSPKAPSSPWIQIHVVNENIAASTFPLLYCGVDALVQPSRGEGWGRPHMEAMAMGVPVIATNWSGTTAFLNDANSFPVMIEKDLRKITKGSFAGHYWAEPDKDHLRSQMRKVVTLARQQPSSSSSSSHELVVKVKRAREDVETHFNGPLIASIIMNRTRFLAHRKCEETRLKKKQQLENVGVNGNAANSAEQQEEQDPASVACGMNIPRWEERWYEPEHESGLRTIQSGYEPLPGEQEADEEEAAML